MKPSNVCQLCGKVNKKEWCIWKLDHKMVKTCKACKEEAENPMDFSYYEKAKKRMEDHRKRNNEEVLRIYRITPSKPKTEN